MSGKRVMVMFTIATVLTFIIVVIYATIEDPLLTRPELRLVKKPSWMQIGFQSQF